MSEFLLTSIFQNHRDIGESFENYRARLRHVNREIKQRLRGQLMFVSSSPVTLPMTTEDLKVDAQIEQGLLRDVRIVTPPSGKRDRFGRVLPGSKQIRIGRTKGQTYIKAEHKIDEKGLVRKTLDKLVSAVFS